MTTSVHEDGRHEKVNRRRVASNDSSCSDRALCACMIKWRMESDGGTRRREKKRGNTSVSHTCSHTSSSSKSSERKIETIYLNSVDYREYTFISGLLPSRCNRSSVRLRPRVSKSFIRSFIKYIIIAVVSIGKFRHVKVNARENMEISPMRMCVAERLYGCYAQTGRAMPCKREH